MQIEKIKEKMKKLLNCIISVALPVSILIISCGTSALVVCAAESNLVHATGTKIVMDGNTEYKYESDITLSVGNGYELVASINSVLSDGIAYYQLSFFAYDKVNKELYKVNEKGSLSGTYRTYKNGNILYDYVVPTQAVIDKVPCKSGIYTVTGFSITGNVKIFKDETSLNNYVKSGDTSGMIEVKAPENEKVWYLKNVSYKVTADDSPSSEAGADATYIHFSWDTDNLQDGDLLEIKTYNYYKKILCEKLSGFYDFITYSDGVNASSGKYSFSQYTATKAWFNSLENKPLAFKEYDTTDYYLRPVRMGTLGVGKYGGWVHIKMGRSTPTSSPYIEDIEYGDFDDDNNWTVDEDLTDKNGGHHGVDQGGGYIPPDQSDNPFTGTNIAGIFSYFYDFMKQIPAMLGDLPALVGNIISFLPKPIIAFIGIGVIVAIILRIVGR